MDRNQLRNRASWYRQESTHSFRFILSFLSLYTLLPFELDFSVQKLFIYGRNYLKKRISEQFPNNKSTSRVPRIFPTSLVLQKRRELYKNSLCFFTKSLGNYHRLSVYPRKQTRTSRKHFKDSRLGFLPLWDFFSKQFCVKLSPFSFLLFQGGITVFAGPKGSPLSFSTVCASLIRLKMSNATAKF